MRVCMCVRADHCIASADMITYIASPHPTPPPTGGHTRGASCHGQHAFTPRTAPLPCRRAVALLCCQHVHPVQGGYAYPPNALSSAGVDTILVHPHAVNALMSGAHMTGTPTTAAHLQRSRTVHVTPLAQLQPLGASADTHSASGVAAVANPMHQAAPNAALSVYHMTHANSHTYFNHLH